MPQAVIHMVVGDACSREDRSTGFVNRAGLSAEANLRRSMVSETMARGVNVTSGSESNSSSGDAYRKL